MHEFYDTICRGGGTLSDEEEEEQEKKKKKKNAPTAFQLVGIPSFLYLIYYLEE